MGWIRDKFEEVKDGTGAPPIDCPRGWGSVSFGLRGEAVLPWFEISRKCPIGGVAECASCGHPYNPDRVDNLRRGLDELENLRRDGVLTEAEAACQREGLMNLTGNTQATLENFRLTAWILGPLGFLFSAAGVILGILMHPGFYGLAGVGAVLLALCISFAGVSRRRAQAIDEAWPRPAQSVDGR